MIRDYQTGDALMIVPQSIQAGEAQIFAEGFEYITSYSLEDEQGGILAVCGFDVFELIRVLANFFAGKTYQLYERKFYYGSSGTLN